LIGGDIMKEYQEIRDTSPLGLKMLNDQLRLLWFKAKNTTTKDIRNGAVTLNKLASDVGQSLDLSSNTSISLKIAEGLNSLEIGGRNLIPNSQSVRMMSNNSATYPIEDEAYGDHRRCRRTFPAGVTSQSLSTYTTFFYNTEKGSIYTISLKVKPEADVVLRLASYGINTLCKAGEWTTLSTTFTATADESRRYMGIYGEGFSSSFMPWIEYKDAKAEKGNKATDWSPAPEDIVKKDKLITEINLTSDTAKIQANKINLVGAVTVLSDIAGNLGTITAGTITGATVRTSSGTSRIEMSSNLLRSYRNGVRRVQLDYDSLDFYTSDNRLGGEVVASVDSFSNLPVISVQSSDGMAFLESRKSSTNYAEIYASAYQGVDDDEALAGINVRRGSNEGNVEVGPGAVFINAAHGYDVTTLSVSGMDGVAVYGDFSVGGDIDKIKTGTCYLSTSWGSFSFGETLPSVPRMTLTSADGVSSISNGKVRNVTRTGFEAVLGGSGYSSSTHHYIAICGEG
jgi:hypothetical protein